MPDDEKPEAAPSGDVTENEDEQKPIEPKKPVVKPVVLPEQIENHETVPTWLKTITDRLDKIEAAIKPAAPKAEPKAEVKKEEEQTDGQTKKNPKRKSGRVKLWRRI